MVKDGEIVYTGSEISQSGEASPRKDESTEGQAGSKKEEQNDKERKDEEDTPLPTYKAKSIVESWVWGRQPEVLDYIRSRFCCCTKVLRAMAIVYKCLETGGEEDAFSFGCRFLG
ncbi:UNVERIFIED_CONTAM: E3 ubiquitin-protein ligase herc2 [Gekko kuhli]